MIIIIQGISGVIANLIHLLSIKNKTLNFSEVIFWFPGYQIVPN